MATEVLRGFDLPEYRLIINNRKILEAQVRVSGIPPEKKADALRGLDKLHKIGKDGVKGEFVKYGLTEKQFEDFFANVVVETLEDAAARISGDEKGREGVAELQEIFAKAEKLGFQQQLKFDWTLVRGLDYYTGPIFEAQAKSEAGFGSFAGGGRYDDLIGLYGGQAQGAVGLSFGVERLIGLLEERGGKAAEGQKPILVAALGPELVEAAQKLSLELRRHGINVRFLGAQKKDKVFRYSTSSELPKLVLVGEGLPELRVAGSQSSERLDVEGLVKALQSS
jgi:histidyl-tRNA synthetase